MSNFEPSLSYSRKINVQHKNVNMTWNYQKCPRHPVAAENFVTRGLNTILLNYHFRVDPELQFVCAIFRTPYACPSCVAQLDKYWLPTITP